MTFLPMTTYDELTPEARAASDADVALNGPMTPTGATLLANLPSFTASRQWTQLREELAPWIGERAVTLFAYTISDANDCEQSALFFRRILVDAGDDPEQPQVTETEQLLIDWGRLIVRTPHDIPDEFYARLEAAFSPERRLTLLAFAAQLSAVNLLNIVGRIPLDPTLAAYRVARADERG
jgi:alkylhydroperoxidase family enzyme